MYGIPLMSKEHVKGCEQRIPDYKHEHLTCIKHGNALDKKK